MTNANTLRALLKVYGKIDTTTQVIASDGRITITSAQSAAAFNAVSIQAHCPTDFTLSAIELRNALQALDGEITISDETIADSQASVTITPVKFPATIPATGHTMRLTLPVFEFKRIASNAISHCPADDVRYYLNGAFIDNDKIVATDGHRLYLDTIPPTNARVIVPVDALVRANRALIKNPCPTVCISLSDSGGCIDVGDYRIDFIALDGRYPDYTRVVPTTESRKVKVAVDRSVAKTLAQFAKTIKRSKYQQAEFSVTANAITMKHESSEVSATASIPCTASGDLVIGFRVQYLVDAINVLTGDSIDIHISPNDSALFQGSTFGQCAVVMPTRL